MIISHNEPAEIAWFLVNIIHKIFMIVSYSAL